MTLNDFTRRVIDRCVQLGQRPPTRDEAETLLPNALDVLAAAVANDDRAPLLQRRFRAAYTGLTGSAPFSTIQADDGSTLSSLSIGSVITETIDIVRYDDGAGNVTTFHRIPGDSEIDYERQSEFFFYDPYIVLNAKIRARMASDPPDAGSLDDGFLTFQSSFTASDLAGLPASGELDSDLVVVAVGLSQGSSAGDAVAG